MNNSTALKTIKWPVKYDDFGQYIFDSENNMVTQVRGFGKYNTFKEEDPCKLQDEVGEFIALAMNEKAIELNFLDRKRKTK